MNVLLLKELKRFKLHNCLSRFRGKCFMSVDVYVRRIREKIEPQTGSTIVEVMQKTVDAALAQRARLGVPMFAHINHPNFGWAITADDLSRVENDRLLEVYNGHPLVNNLGGGGSPGVEQMWDTLLTGGKV